MESTATATSGEGADEGAAEKTRVNDLDQLIMKWDVDAVCAKHAETPQVERSAGDAALHEGAAAGRTSSGSGVSGEGGRHFSAPSPADSERTLADATPDARVGTSAAETQEVEAAAEPEPVVSTAAEKDEGKGEGKGVAPAAAEGVAPAAAEGVGVAPAAAEGVGVAPAAAEAPAELQSVVASQSVDTWGAVVPAAAKAKVVPLWSSIPLWGPRPYGVWTGRIIDGVESLRSYLLTNWMAQGRKLPMGGTSDIMCYTGYPLTADKYNRVMQEQNSLRWGCSAARLEGLRAHLPGYAEIERGVGHLLEAKFPNLAHGLGLHNGHILRQFYGADGGSGFNEHIDEADDASKTLLWLSVAIKLTDDPPGGTVQGTWMQVSGYEPVRYGRESGSVIMFLSRRPHRSMRTPPHMKKVLKLVLFYKFSAPQLQEQYKHVAPPSPEHTSPRPLSVLPSQEKTIRKACADSFEECKKTLAISWTSSSDTRVVLNHAIEQKFSELPPYHNPVYGIGAEVSL